MTDSKSPFSPQNIKQPKAVARATAVKAAPNALPRVDAPAAAQHDTTEDPLLAAKIAAIRESRVDFGEFDQRLGAPQRVGYERRWVNDTSNGAVDKKRKRGWGLVQDGDGKPIHVAAGTAEEGGKLSAYLLEIPKVIYDEDQEKKQDRLDEIDMAISAGRDEGRGRDRGLVPNGTEQSAVRLKVEDRR